MVFHDGCSTSLQPPIYVGPHMPVRWSTEMCRYAGGSTRHSEKHCFNTTTQEAAALAVVKSGVTALSVHLCQLLQKRVGSAACGARQWTVLGCQARPACVASNPRAGSSASHVQQTQPSSSPYLRVHYHGAQPRPMAVGCATAWTSQMPVWHA